VSAPNELFRFLQVELPWQLGPPDGRYLLRLDADPDGPASHVIVFATLGAVERRRLASRRRTRAAEPRPDPTPVTTGRATVIEAGSPFENEPAAREWLQSAGEGTLEEGIETLNRALHAFRLVTADPYLHPVARRHVLIARAGYGAGEQVADGLWSDARELILRERRLRRAQVLHPQSRLAAVLGGRERALACEELILRTRTDVDHGRDREAALQLLVALDAALAELPGESSGAALEARMEELRGQREPVAHAAQAALDGQLSAGDRETVEFALGRIEAALRARAVENA
jgi:hypothetical protein